MVVPTKTKDVSKSKEPTAEQQSEGASNQHRIDVYAEVMHITGLSRKEAIALVKAGEKTVKDGNELLSYQENQSARRRAKRRNARAHGLALEAATKTALATTNLYQPIVKGGDDPHTHHKLYSAKRERRPLDVVMTSEQLHDLLQVRSAVAGVPLTEEQLKLASETAFNAVIAGVIANPGTFRDPVTGLEFPPKPRDVDYQHRGNGPSGKRMTFADYLRDESHGGWGEYTKHSALGSFWVLEYDKPLYQAILYQANKDADAQSLPKHGEARAAAIDGFFLRHGVLTPHHLDVVPNPDLERIAKLLSFIRKQQYTFPKGRAPGAEIEERN